MVLEALPTFLCMTMKHEGKRVKSDNTRFWAEFSPPKMFCAFFG